MNIFNVPHFEFPYDYKFPGQATNERILFITRENPIMLLVRRFSIGVAAILVLLTGLFLGGVVGRYAGLGLASLIEVIAAVAALTFLIAGWWWVTTLWRKSLAIVTTQRMTKFIYTTPANRHNLSLPLEMIVDTGSYTKGFLQAIFRLGTFTARSSAASSGVATDDPQAERVNKKYFYIENLATAEDLQHYMNKLVYAFHHYPEHMATFRPFIPQLKGEARKRFMEDHPGYWS